jgi:O-antigen/teichoic acid export membrane protein
MPMLSFGWPYMLVAVLMMIVPTIDRYFIINFLSLELMGVYAIGYKLVSLIQLVISGFQTAWGPFSFSIYKEKNACETYNSVLLYFVIVISIMAYLLVALARPLIYVFASAKYLDSAIVLLPLVFSKLVDSVSWITGVGISLSKRTSVNVLCYFIGTATAAILIWALVKPFGIVGVAYGVLGGQVVLTVSRTWFANRLYHLRFKVIPATVFLSISFIFSLTAQTLNGRSWFIQVGSNAVLLSSMVVLALWLARRKKAITIIKGLI